MRRHKVWSIAAAICVAILLLVSCKGPGTTTTPPTTTTKPPTTTPPTTTPGSNNPVYGGTITVVNPGDILAFDEGTNPVFFTISTHLTNDELLTGDWTKGPAGTGQFTWLSNGTYSWTSKAASVAETWDIVEPGHMIFHIHQGIHFGLNTNSAASKLVNGRELTGDDVVYTLNRMLTLQGSYWISAANAWTKSAKVTLTDKYTVDVTCDPLLAFNFATYMVDWGSIVPKEVIDKYGDMKDWRNSVGSGPYFLTDFVSNSAANFEKNPNYWRTDPVGAGKGNQLPYIQSIKMLLITDTSTVLSAMRTARVDLVQGQFYDDAQTLTNPKLEVLSYVPQNLSHINMRTDKADLPYHDIRVRQALMKATDFKTIINDLMAGQAEIPSWPLTPMPDFINAFLPLDEAPAAVQDLYTYDTTKAKQLLADAGYPDGFSAGIFYNNTVSFNSDYLSVIAEMWGKVNVKLTLNPLEFGVYNTRWAQRSYDDLFYGLMASAGTYWRAANIAGTGSGWNLSYVDDATVNSTRDQMVSAFILGDDAKVDSLHKNLMKYVLAQAWAIPTPVQNLYTKWWPWLKGYHGEGSPGVINEWQWIMYTWIDPALKTGI
jgi:peptide/nickel transport system substrate-binding protein